MNDSRGFEAHEIENFFQIDENSAWEKSADCIKAIIMCGMSFESFAKAMAVKNVLFL